MEFDGHVRFQGKGGVCGKPVMRNGMIVGYAGASGLLPALKASPAATPSAGLPVPLQVLAQVMLKQGFGGGASRRPTRQASTGIKRAEQYHPVIDIGAGNPSPPFSRRAARKPLKTLRTPRQKRNCRKPATPRRMP